MSTVHRLHEQASLGERFKSFALEQVAPHAHAHDSEQTFSVSVIEALKDQGYLGACLPAVAGGLGLDMTAYGSLCEALGHACTSARNLLTVHDMVVHTVAEWGSPAQRDAWLPVLARGERIAAFALTERSAGSDARGIETEARETGSGFVLNGSKSWITFGQIAGLFLVFARTGDAISAFIVESERNGVEVAPIKDMLGARGSMLAQLSLTDCLVPKENMIGRRGKGYPHILTDALTLGRYTVAAGTAGLQRACLEASIGYVRQRKQFGKPIAEHQLIQRKIAAMATDAAAGKLLVEEAGRHLDAGHPRALAQVAMAKLFTTRAAFRAASEAVQIHGANGCSADYPVNRHLRDAKILEIIEGTNEIQEIIISRYA